MFLGNTEESVLLRENGKFWKIAHKGKNLAVWSAHVESGGGGGGPVADRAISPGQSIFDTHYHHTVKNNYAMLPSEAKSVTDLKGLKGDDG